jgi:hypothetical protein
MKKKTYKCPLCGVANKPHPYDLREKEDICAALGIILNEYTASLACQCQMSSEKVEVLGKMVDEAKRYLDEKYLLIVASQKAYAVLPKVPTKKKSKKKE